MSITQLAPVGVSAALAAVDAGIDRLAGTDVSVLSGVEAVELVRRTETMRRRLDALRLHAVARVEATRAARGTGAVSTAALLHADGAGPGEAKRDVALAGQLEAHARVVEAMSRGQITAPHAEVITAACGQLPPLARAAGEARLVHAATAMDPVQLRQEAVRVVNDLHPDGPALLEQRELKARRRRELAIVASGDGYVLAGRLDVEGAATVSAAIDGLAAPRPSSADGPDPRTPAQRRGDALVELARRFLTTAHAPDTGGARPRVVVTMTLDQLRGHDHATATLTGGTITAPISAAAARRAACDAGIVPVVLGGRSEVLDLGRERRTASPAQRKALRLRDRGCAFPGCDRPPGWTDAHHIQPWANGGPTDLDNLVLVCGPHHDLVHHHRWTITTGPDHRPRFHPPDRPHPARRL